MILGGLQTAKINRVIDTMDGKEYSFGLEFSNRGNAFTFSAFAESIA